MSFYSSMYLTVRAPSVPYFLMFLSTLKHRTPTVYRCDDGDVTAVWEDVNHFVEDSEEYDAILDFLDQIDIGDYYYETVEENGYSDSHGNYYGRWNVIHRVEVEGDPYGFRQFSGNSKPLCGRFGRRCSR